MSPFYDITQSTGGGVFFSFFLFFSRVLHVQTVGLHHISFCPSQSPIDAIRHSGSILAGIRTCLKDDLNVLLHYLSKRNSLYFLFYFHLFIRFGERGVYAVQQSRAPNAAESTQPLQNSHVWAQEELIMLQPTLSAAPRPWKWDRLDIFSLPQTCSRNRFLFRCASLFYSSWNMFRNI